MGAWCDPPLFTYEHFLNFFFFVLRINCFYKLEPKIFIKVIYEKQEHLPLRGKELKKWKRLADRRETPGARGPLTGSVVTGLTHLCPSVASCPVRAGMNSYLVRCIRSRGEYRALKDDA